MPQPLPFGSSKPFCSWPGPIHTWLQVSEQAEEPKWVYDGAGWAGRWGPGPGKLEPAELAPFGTAVETLLLQVPTPTSSRQESFQRLLPRCKPGTGLRVGAVHFPVPVATPWLTPTLLVLWGGHSGSPKADGMPRLGLTA